MRLTISAVLTCCLLSSAALGQLTPEREFNGVNRPIPMSVEVPDGGEGEVEIALFAPTSGEAMEVVSAEEGRVDIAALFPVLWTAQSSELRYAQLMVGGEKVGSPVVLQAMSTPALAGLAGNQVRWNSIGQTYSGIRAYTDRHVVIETTLGEIEVRLRPDSAPNTARHFLTLAEGGYYTDIIFHRVVPRAQNGEPFVIQAGDPTGSGTGGPGVMIDLEQSELPHDFGVISMARGPDPNTNGGQFFLCLSRAGTSFLDGNYTAFGQTVRGGDVILEIASTPLSDERAGKPAEPPVIERAYTVPAPPYGEAPAAVTREGSAQPQER